MANVLRSLLTPLGYFEMADDARWQEYQKEVTTEGGSQDVLARGMQAWAALTDMSIVEKRRTTSGILTTEFMNALDKVMTKEVTESMWFRTEGEDWQSYCEDVERLFNQFVYKQPFEQPEERQVRDQWRRKWDFVKFDHLLHHMQKPLMLLTPTSVETLAMALGKVTEAHSEVSTWFIHITEPSACDRPVHIHACFSTCT